MVTTFFNERTITVEVPEDLADNWTNTSQVGFEAIIDMKVGEPLRLLIEKDFRCLHRESEDAADLYPNPLEGNES